VTKLLNKDDILNAPDLPMEEVEVPQWGGTVLIRGMTGAQRDAFEALMLDDKADNVQNLRQNFRARMVSMAIVDAEGNIMFTPEDIDALGNKSAQALDLVFEKIQKLNAFKKEDVDELVKN